MLFFKLCPVSYNTPYEKIGDEVRSLADEVPFDIPDSWEWVRIRSLGEIVRGSGIKRNETVQQGLPCVRYGELYTTYQTSFTSAVSFIAPDLYEKCKHFSYGDVLMTLTGENKPDIAKAVAYLGTEPIAASGDLAFWTQHGMNPLFLSYIMASPYIIARKVALATGDIIVHISGDKLGTILLPVPPLAEQERIVACIQEAELVIENYAIKATALQKLQDSFPEALKKSILQEAVQGKLVPQDPSDEPAEALLERIRAEKQRLIKEGKIKKDKHESVIFRRDNSHYEKLDGVERRIDDELPFEIPESWAWARLGNIGDWGSGATPSRTHPEYYDGSIPWLKTGDLTDSYITDIPEGISQLALEKTSVRLNESGSVLMAMYGATIGKLGILTYSATTNQACCACKPVYGVETLFLFYFLMSQRTAFIKRGEGGAQPNISKEKIVTTLMPLPPLAEQHRIVQRIEELLPLVKGL
ncbi:restriction endonuclease subunit S [Flavonifractor plautii]|uniref:restriction endonuclease subunit S n=1 Tax=Flavonifractor plautii TaxID=292800 RepID=UPI0032EB090C